MSEENGKALRIQPVGKLYAAKLAALHGQCFANGWSALEFESFFERPGIFAALALTTGSAPEPVGFVLCWVADEVCDLLSVGVLPEYRREGVGLKLVKYAAHTARDMGAKRIMLEVNIRNEAAIAMYEELGYMKDGVRKQYYTNPDNTRSDALKMVKAL